MVGAIIKYLTVIGSVYIFSYTAYDVYNATIITGACKAAVKEIILDCTPP